MGLRLKEENVEEGRHYWKEQSLLGSIDIQGVAA
jgi:hypothetical protein